MDDQDVPCEGSGAVRFWHRFREGCVRWAAVHEDEEDRERERCPLEVPSGPDGETDGGTSEEGRPSGDGVETVLA